MAERRILSEAPGHASLAFGTANKQASDPVRDRVMGVTQGNAESDEDDDDLVGGLERMLTGR